MIVIAGAAAVVVGIAVGIIWTMATMPEKPKRKRLEDMAYRPSEDALLEESDPDALLFETAPAPLRASRGMCGDFVTHVPASVSGNFTAMASVSGQTIVPRISGENTWYQDSNGAWYKDYGPIGGLRPMYGDPTGI